MSAPSRNSLLWIEMRSLIWDHRGQIIALHVRNNRRHSGSCTKNTYTSFWHGACIRHRHRNRSVVIHVYKKTNGALNQYIVPHGHDTLPTIQTLVILVLDPNGDGPQLLDDAMAHHTSTTHSKPWLASTPSVDRQLPSILVEADFVSASWCPLTVWMCELYTCKFYIYQPHRKYTNLWYRFSNYPDLTKLPRLLTCMREACTEYLEKLINTP